jgi:hypothetical protein
MRRLIGGIVVGALLGVAGACGTSSSESGSTPGKLRNADSGGSAASDGFGAPVQDGGTSAAETGAGGSGGNSGDGGGATTADATSQTDGSAVADGGTAPVPYKGVANSACSDLIRLGVTWYYNWELSPPCPTPEFVPMIWGHTGTEQTASGIASELSGLVGSGYRTVLGFNEPDNTGQSNIPEATAISLWPSFTTDASVRVGSPATQANATGQAWFTSFMQSVNADTTGKLRVDFIAAHWYGWNTGSCDDKAASLESYINWLEAIPGNRPIWLTEWGCLNDSNPTAAVVQAFFSGAITMFAKHPRVERYAWYPWTTNNELVDADGGALTSLGTVFAAAPPNQ